MIGNVIKNVEALDSQNIVIYVKDNVHWTPEMNKFLKNTLKLKFPDKKFLFISSNIKLLNLSEEDMKTIENILFKKEDKNE